MSNLVENNKLISEFVVSITGETIITADEFNKLGEGAYTGKNEGVRWHILDYKWYHSSWLNLMEAIEAIENSPNYPFFVNIIGNGCYIDTTNPNIKMKKEGWIVSSSEIFSYEEGLHPSKIEAVYRTVVEFVKWYNLQK